MEVNADASGQGEALAAFQEMEAFRSAHGAAWRFTVDLRRGVPTLLGGGAMPMIPGDANDLRWEDFAPGCRENACIPLSTVESLARGFMEQNSSIFGVNPSQLEIDPEGSGPVGDTMYFIRFQWKVGGVPVERGSVYFRINRGNLIQVATDGISPIQIDPSPDVSAADARAVVEDYLGPFGGESDRVVDAGSLHIIPVTPAGQDPDRFEGAVGSGIDYRLAHRFAFERSGVIGTWEALVDAHTGELLRFVDTNRYGRIHGGAYPGDNHTGEADRPFPFADTGLPVPNQYRRCRRPLPRRHRHHHAAWQIRADLRRLRHDQQHHADGDVDFSLGPGTDCEVPPGNTGGSGNTHSARTQYYHLTTANLRAQAWLPGNSWLGSSYITVNTNSRRGATPPPAETPCNFYLRFGLLESRRDSGSVDPRVGSQPGQLRRFRWPVPSGGDLRRLDGGPSPA